MRLKTDEDFANNQRCLYFDKQVNKSILNGIDPNTPEDTVMPEHVGGMTVATIDNIRDGHT